MFLFFDDNLEKSEGIRIEYSFDSTSGVLDCQDFVSDILNIDFFNFTIIREYFNFHKELGHIKNDNDYVDIYELIGEEKLIKPYDNWKNIIDSDCFLGKKFNYLTLSLLNNFAFTDNQLINLYTKILISFNKNFYQKNQFETNNSFKDRLKYALKDFLQPYYFYSSKCEADTCIPAEAQLMYLNNIDNTIDKLQWREFHSTAEMIIDDILIKFNSIDTSLKEYVATKAKALMSRLRNFHLDINLSYNNTVTIIEPSLTFNGFLSSYFGIELNKFKKYAINEFPQHNVDSIVVYIKILYQMLRKEKFIEHFKQELTNNCKNSSLIRIPNNYYYDYEINNPVDCESYLNQLYESYKTKAYKIANDQYLLGSLFCSCLIILRLYNNSYTVKHCLICGHYFHTTQKKELFCPICKQKYKKEYKNYQDIRKNLSNLETTNNKKIPDIIKKYRKELIKELEETVKELYISYMKNSLYFEKRQLNSFSYNFVPEFIKKTELELINLNNNNILYLESSVYNINQTLTDTRKKYLVANKIKNIFDNKFLYKQASDFESFKTDMEKYWGINVEEIKYYNDIKNYYISGI